ncbi:hypothetical protein B5P43_31810 [Bacillus sp. SRB_336]|nr:hypothetical protein B5P43_31810 [Bacillus sp. SRB_336]
MNTITPTQEAPAAVHPLTAAALRLYELTKRPDVARRGGRKLAIVAHSLVERMDFTDDQAAECLNAAAETLEELAAASEVPEVAA